MKYLKTFENHSVTEASFRDNLYNASTIITGKPKTWEINKEKSEKLTREVAKILIDRGYNLTEESGIMTDSSEIWSLQDQGMQPIVFNAKYDDYDSKAGAKILVGFYFPTQHKGTEETVEIDETDLEGTADKVAEVIEKLRQLGHTGNIFSRQGSIRVGLAD
jgi:hypothetical protein